MKKFVLKSWIETFANGQGVAKSKAPAGYLVVLGSSEKSLYSRVIGNHALEWQKSLLEKSEKESVHFIGVNGPVWILRPTGKKEAGHEGLLNESPYAWARDQVGGLLSSIKNQHLNTLHVELDGTSDVQDLGVLVGFDVATYQFKSFMAGEQMAELPKVFIAKEGEALEKDLFVEAKAIARSVNLARHLVNLPPNELNPKTFADLAAKGLSFGKLMKVEVWNHARLIKEGMGLHAAVGQGAEHAPCMVRLKYRPTGTKKKKPIAFVGKGITFDTGGLDLKPSSAMRLMKKDMGGAAAVLALALYVSESGYSQPCDFYLALAENAVDAKSFRPGDIVKARNGMTVEIDNTDAEGRLVLADVMDVAVNQKGADEPEYLIDVATLTGAIKVGLGAEIAGLFSNDDTLANQLNSAGQRAGDLNWRMPLFDRYWGALSSHFADCKNSGDGFGGAITAALFLQKFAKGKKWAHLDIYAWTDKAHGCLGQTGGNGQPVQALIEFLRTRA